MDNQGKIENKNANNKVDVLYKIWLGLGATKITLVDDPDGDVQEIRELLDDSVNDSSTKSC